MQKKPFSFQGYQKAAVIVRNVGDLKEVYTLDGFKVERRKEIFLTSFNEWYECAQYDNHFIYIDPSNKKGRWNPLCTCGSFAGVVGYQAYSKDASPTKNGKLAVCLSHAGALDTPNSRKHLHADGSS